MANRQWDEIVSKSHLCAFCGFPYVEGDEHIVWLDSKQIGCRVSVLCQNRLRLGVITDDSVRKITDRSEPMPDPRTITTHHDGHGLNESIVISTDQPDASGAAHKYDLSINGDAVGLIQFQQGPRNVEGSRPGATEAAILAVLIDRLEGFQAGPYACYENAVQLSNLYACLSLTKARANARAKRGVLGKNEK